MLFLTLITSISPTHSDQSKVPLTVCKSLKSGKQFISKTGKCNERIYEARDWYEEGTVPTGTPGSKLIALNLCTSKKSQISLIREKCNPRTQHSDTYQRSYGPPAAPLVPSATADLLGSAILSFAAPAVDGGALISSYTITATPGAITSIIAPKDIKRATVSGLIPGVTYRFSITATNSQGESLASPSSEAMLAPNLPDAPSITSLILNGDNSARLHYDHTTFDGGAAISSYKATITSSGIVVATRQISPGVLELTGLPYSTTLSISLSARNVAGSSIASSASNFITTATPPPPPEPEPSPTPSSSAAPSLAAPAFTLSSSTEDVTVDTAATGFTITSTGGEIASFAISPAAPGGMSFNTSTGAFSGTPTATQSATTYTITATNATGSATQTFSFTVSAAVISVAAIGGVTAPVKDATPVTAVTAANGYTGTVTWSGSPTTFAASTTYTATITLTAADGYTLTGVSENFFTVAGATSVTHAANSGVITAVFPATVLYAVGDPGPGGGTIFYYSASGFNCGPTFSATGSPTGGKCNYLEAAPTTGSNAWTDAGYEWSGNTTTNVAGAVSTSIGTGYSNTLAIVAQSNTAERAATKARSYRGPNNLSDWYLPSQDELYQTFGIIPLDGRYWTSTQISNVSANARLYIFDRNAGTRTLGGGAKTQTNKVRPIRAFGNP